MAKTDIGARGRAPKKPNPPEDSSVYYPIEKYYVFSETGNIVLCTTEAVNQEFDSDIKDAFTDVSVFFAAMTKALASTINSATGKPFSIYNFFAVEKVLCASGMFVEVQSQMDTFNSSGVGESLAQTFIEKALNRKLDRSKLGFGRGMFQGMREQQSAQQGQINQTGQLFFVCESLMGLPQTTAILLNIRDKSVTDKPASDRQEIELEEEAEPADVLDLGVRSETQHKFAESGAIERKWQFTKKVYLFVPPKLVAKNSDDFNGIYPSGYANLIETMKDAL
ncbi:hypothetical protein [Gayadomonas joobiniege]|uniref:hypothetical protein n=1 Tax=Gayadomonas joobiniege TaxID=1234606 RepID=UPI000367D020|nr:hypothetical protein [Gayadomonas joobiniege]